MSLLSQGCQYSDGARSIGAQDKADFENSESGISIHYDGGNAARYIATLLHICICMHIYVTISLYFIAHYVLLLQDFLSILHGIVIDRPPYFVILLVEPPGFAVFWQLQIDKEAS